MTRNQILDLMKKAYNDKLPDEAIRQFEEQSQSPYRNRDFFGLISYSDDNVAVELIIKNHVSP